MSDKIRITAERVISRGKGQVKYYADDGSIVTAKSKLVQIVQEGEEKQLAPEDSRRNFGSEEQAQSAAAIDEAVQSLTDDSTSDQADPTATPDSPPKRGRKKSSKENTVATAKKGGKRKTAAKKASNGAVVRMVAGREHDISNYEKVKNAAGHTSFDNGDKVAHTLRGKTLDEVYEIVAKKLGETEKDLRAKYKKLNPGMQRMNLGNRLRKVLAA